MLLFGWTATYVLIHTSLLLHLWKEGLSCLKPLTDEFYFFINMNWRISSHVQCHFYRLNPKDSVVLIQSVGQSAANCRSVKKMDIFGRLVINEDFSTLELCSQFLHRLVDRSQTRSRQWLRLLSLGLIFVSCIALILLFNTLRMLWKLSSSYRILDSSKKKHLKQGIHGKNWLKVLCVWFSYLFGDRNGSSAELIVFQMF